MLDALMQAFAGILTFGTLLPLLLGVVVGIVIGVLPGLGGVVGFSLLLPFVFNLEPSAAIAMLIGLAAVVPTSDTFPSVLMGIPGSSGSQATIMDGYPLARKGQGARALGAAFTASLMGGLIGALVLTAAIPIARPLILMFGSPELLMLAILGLTMVGILSAGNALRGVLAGIVGLMIGTIGAAPSDPEYRFTFDILYLYDGVPLIVVALGLFAIPEIVDLLASGRAIAPEKGGANMGQLMRGIREGFAHWRLVLRCSGIGVIIGAIPGLGGSVVDWISYSQAKATIPNNHFGEGDIRGVIAPESSNNAKEGGALLPTLLFGIPGSGSMAVLLGGMTLLGIQPGPSMVTTDLPITLTAIWSLAIANILGVVICIALAGVIARLCFVPFPMLAPAILLVVVFGAYQATRSWGDWVALVLLGILGWLMKRYGWSRPAILVGFVLAPITEQYFFISMSRYGLEWMLRPGVVIVGVLILALLVSGFLLSRKEKKGVA
ncbi:tripartite tricarboxylate transporter permease [Pelagibacterium montanilacus]|uniref:tripartite tricarboxylate transporter permease n=1 Tax=Pelagibacterium montanilacus TaxID=2185280 RepID=UPI000F8DC12B|nr:tripartite tricarboxylate transporter permease [Pelagibacterium montanilacus]